MTFLYLLVFLNYFLISKVFESFFFIMVLRADMIFVLILFFIEEWLPPGTLVYVSSYYFLNIVLFDYIWLMIGVGSAMAYLMWLLSYSSSVL